MIEFDVETTGFQPYSGKHYPFLFQFFDGNEHVVLPWAPDNHEHDAAIQGWLDRGATEGIRAWNSKFDFAFAESAGFTLPPDDQWHDGMIVAHAVNERRSLALKSVAVEYFGEDADDLKKQVHAWLAEERRRRKKEAQTAGEELIEPNFSDVPMELMERYALEDVFLTKSVCDVMEPIVEARSDLSDIVEFERRVMGALYAVERRGLPADETGYRRLEQEVIENLDVLEDRAIELGQKGLTDGREFNPRSSKHIYDSLKAQGADLSYVEGESMDAENLATVDHPLADAILGFRSEFKVLSTYVRPMIGRSWEKQLRVWKEPFVAPDGRIHTTYRQVGARTGRMSSADPNVQNQPRDDLRLRYNIVAPEGYKLVTVDLSNIEMVLLAAYAGKGRLLDAVWAGEDLHALTARMLGLRDRKRGAGVTTARQLAKGYNFSRLYGGGLKTVQKQFRCSRDQARLYNRRYDEAFPEAKRLRNMIEYRLEDQGFIRSLWGRNFRSDRPRAEGYKFTNYLIQGTAADLLKAALLRCHQDGLPIVGLVHDELLAIVPDQDAEEVRDLMVKHMTAESREGGKLWNPDTEKPRVPLSADGDIVQRWSDAKPLKDENGRPYLFTPEWAGGERRYV